MIRVKRFISKWVHRLAHFIDGNPYLVFMIDGTKYRRAIPHESILET